MKTEQLIADLAGRLTPVRPLHAPRLRTLAWTATALPVVAVALALFGPRADIAERLTQPDFLWTLGLAGLVGTLAAVAALIIAVPGAERSAALRTASLVLIGVWGFGLTVAAISQGSAIAGDPHWRACFARVIAVGILPAAMLGVMVRRAAALRPGLAGLLVTVAAMALATIAVQVACPLDDPGHSLSGHFSPVLAMGAVGSMAGRRLLGLRVDESLPA
jgi:hypothetical protein